MDSFKKNGLENLNSSIHSEKNSLAISEKIIEMAGMEQDDVLKSLGTSSQGLAHAEAHKRLNQYGLNEVAQEKRQNWLIRLLNMFRQPLVILLLVLGTVSFYTRDV